MSLSILQTKLKSPTCCVYTNKSCRQTSESQVVSSNFFKNFWEHSISQYRAGLLSLHGVLPWMARRKERWTTTAICICCLISSSEMQTHLWDIMQTNWKHKLPRQLTLNAATILSSLTLSWPCMKKKRKWQKVCYNIPICRTLIFCRPN